MFSIRILARVMFGARFSVMVSSRLSIRVRAMVSVVIGLGLCLRLWL